MKSHRKHSSTDSPETSWAILHNDAADAAAKAANRNRPPSFLALYSRLLEGWKQELSDRCTLSELQSKETARSKEARATAAPAVLPALDRLQLQLERMAMQANDRTFALPAAIPKPELQYFVLPSPFAEMLRGFLMDQAWIPDDSGFSILELYIFFTHITGWLVPINICGWDNDTRPPALRSSSAQACWAHETDWDRLALMRQPLNVQCRTFLFILRELFSLHASALGENPKALIAPPWSCLSCADFAVSASCYV